MTPPKVGCRLMPKMTAHISNAEPAIRARIVRMSGAGGKRPMGRPCGAFRLLAFGGCVGVEIEGEDQARVNVTISGSQRERIPQVPDRIHWSREVVFGVGLLEDRVQFICGGL